jgi:hypothetical protein
MVIAVLSEIAAATIAVARASTTQREVAFSVWGTSKRGFAMTCKIIGFEFVVLTAMATTLAVKLSIGAVYLTDKFLGPIEQAEAHGLPSAAGRVDQ